MHDIGKFYQRADPDHSRQSKRLSTQIKNMEGHWCPLFNGTYSHKHVLWTGAFFEEIEPKLKPLLEGAGLSYGEMMNIAAAHHNPTRTDLLQCIIQKADHYSSGIDRTKSQNAAREGAEERETFRTKPMRSIFEGISLTGNYPDSANYKYRLPLTGIALDEKYFPQEKGVAETVDYAPLWEDFMGEVHHLDVRTLEAFSDTMLYLLEKYTSRIPSTTIHLPDVSLFEHLKSTAAFALAIYDYCTANDITDIGAMDGDPFLLIGGDVSGIQKFIYNIISKGAAKNLKGRSFYLQLLVDTIVAHFVKETKLYAGNVVYASGGSFYILAPNTKEVRDKADAIEIQIARALFKEHGLQLSLVTDTIAFGERQIFAGKVTEDNIGSLWKGLVDKLGKKKGAKLGPILLEKFDSLFEAERVDSKEGRDAITMDELGTQRKKLDDGTMVNLSTYLQIELGKCLKSTKYQIISSEALTYFNADHSIQPLGLGIYHYFISDKELKEHENKLRNSADNVKVVYFNNEEFTKTRLARGVNNSYGFVWYGGNDYPKNNGEPKSFNELCGDDDADGGKPSLVRLGILRMDVDNLGRIFKQGFHPEKRTFSRYSTLSRSLDFFFKGYLNKIWSGKEAFKNNTQIVYSGGDDLFIVGKWVDVIAFGAEIRTAFKRWTCDNPELTLSGGVAAVSAKFPLLKAAAFAEDFEKAAKAHAYGKVEKNALAFLNMLQDAGDEVFFAFNWDTEFPVVLELKNRIGKMIDDEELASGFTSDMLNLMAQADFRITGQRKYYPQNLDVLWLIAYKFKRAQKDKAEELTKFLKEWQTNIMSGRMTIDGTEKMNESVYHPLQILAVAARWAAFEERSKSKN